MIVLCVLDVDVLLMRCGIFPLLFDKILIVRLVLVRLLVSLIMADYYAYCSYGLFSLLMNLFIFNSTFFLGLLFVFVYICSGCLLFYVVAIVGEN